MENPDEPIGENFNYKNIGINMSGFAKDHEKTPEEIEKMRIEKEVELTKAQITKVTETHDCNVTHCDPEKVALALVSLQEQIDELNNKIII